MLRPSRPWLEASLIVLLGIPVFFLPWEERPVSGILEERVAITVREMWRQGEWILPTMNGVPRLQKPPLAYWLVEACAVLRGTFDDKTLRLPFALLAVATCLLVWRMGSRVAGSTAGFLSALSLLTTALFIKECRMATADAALVFATVLATHFYLKARAAAVSGAQDSRAALGYYAALGLGVLAKGPVILLTAVAPVVVESLVTWSLLPLRPLRSRSGPVVFLVLALAWPAAVVLARWNVEGVAPPETLHQWYLESFGKVLPGAVAEAGYRFHSHAQPWYYYLPRIFAVVGLWSPVLTVVLVLHARRPGLLRAVWLHFVVTFVGFSLVSEKKTAYLLPLTWASAVLVGSAMAEYFPAYGPRLRWLRWVASGLALAVVVLLGHALLSPSAAARLAWLLGGDEGRIGAEAFLQRPWLLTTAVGIAATGIVLWGWLLRAASPRPAFLALTAALAICTPLYNELKRGLPQVEGDVRAAARETAGVLDPTLPLFCLATHTAGAVGSLPGGFVYYLDRRVELIDTQILASLGRVPPGAGLLVTAARLESLGGVSNAETTLREVKIPQDLKLQGPFAGFELTSVVNLVAQSPRDWVAILRRGTN